MVSTSVGLKPHENPVWVKERDRVETIARNIVQNAQMAAFGMAQEGLALIEVRERATGERKWALTFHKPNDPNDPSKGVKFIAVAIMTPQNVTAYFDPSDGDGGFVDLGGHPGQFKLKGRDGALHEHGFAD